MQWWVKLQSQLLRITLTTWIVRIMKTRIKMFWVRIIIIITLAILFLKKQIGIRQWKICQGTATIASTISWSIPSHVSNPLIQNPLRKLSPVRKARSHLSPLYQTMALIMAERHKWWRKIIRPHVRLQWLESLQPWKKTKNRIPRLQKSRRP